jgi:murein L,D-transpeptidase YafK
MNRQVLLRILSRMALAAAIAGIAAACDDQSGLGGRALRPIPPETLALMEQKGTTKNAPILIRAYKKEAELEVWKQKTDGRYTLLKTFPMCRWSGQLGPKTHEGDRQVPEGFYTITPGQMNPNSNYYLSFNVGYPNAYDRAYGYSGGSIMVHGACSSAGCFSMTDEQIAEIYAIARDAFNGGQRSIQLESLPFRMTAENLAKHRADPNAPFWAELKLGADHFEVTKQEPTVGVCGKHYVFDASPVDPKSHLEATAPCPPLQTDPSIEAEVAAKQSRDRTEVAEMVAKGVKPVRIVYQDGGQHPDFRTHLADVSRPDAIAAGPREIVLDERTGKPVAETEPVVAKTVATTMAKAAPAKPAETIAAPAEMSALAPDTTGSLPATALVPAETPFYKRLFNFAKPAAAEPVAQAPSAAIEPASAPQPVYVPLPPRRQVDATKPQASVTKPQASVTKPTSHPVQDHGAVALTAQ